MKGRRAHLDTIGCGPEITSHLGYFEAAGLPRSINHHETPPVTAGVVCFLDKY